MTIDKAKERLTSAVIIGQGGRVAFDPTDVAAVVRDHDAMAAEVSALRVELRGAEAKALYHAETVVAIRKVLEIPAEVTSQDVVDGVAALRAEKAKGCDLPQGCCEWCGVAKEARFERDCIRQVLDSMMGIVCRPLNLNPSGVSENDVRAGMDSLVQERDALRAELVAVLRESVGQGCSYYADGEVHPDASHSEAMRRLAELGACKIIRDDGRRVVARWKV